MDHAFPYGLALECLLDALNVGKRGRAAVLAFNGLL